MSNTSYPASAICYILTDIPGDGELQGTGVIIGPHTILTAAHLVYDGDTGAYADAVSVYPGFEPGSTAYNPPGALGGYQSIHTIKVATRDDTLLPADTQSDFAVIDTSADLSAYGKVALDGDFTFGDGIVEGYPASAAGALQGTGGTVYQDGSLSDLVTRALDLSPGYSGAPILNTVERDGATLFAAAGLVSTGADATKLTKRKIDLIRHWIASDSSLYDGGQDAPRGLVPQIAGTVSDTVDAARVAGGGATLAAHAGFTYAALAGHPGTEAGHRHGADGAVPRGLADLVAALHGPGSAGGQAVFTPPEEGVAAALAAPGHAHGGHRRAAAIGA